jgi:hypothetical protein
MSLMSSTSERLRRATQLWHAYLAAAGVRFDLAQFLKDPALEKQVLEGALASGDQKVIALAQDWLRDSGQAQPAVVTSRVIPPPQATTQAAAPAEAPKPSRYMRGVR